MHGSGGSLVVMAAGVGSRFGGTKQLAEVGPSGEALLDYTIVDARRAGFGHVVLIVREAIRDDVAEHLARFHDDADRFVLVCQDLDPGAPPRAKPWGTGHAVLTVRDHVAGPFVVVNADDYYGREAFGVLADALDAPGSRGSSVDPRRRDRDLHLVAYRLDQTLSPRGSVSRGICTVRPDGTLAGIAEQLTIERAPDGTIRAGDDGPVLAPETPVSMNLWGLRPFIFDHLAAGFARFTGAHGARGSGGATDERAEYLLPEVIGGLVASGTARVLVHPTQAAWLGVTYPGDLDDARRHIADLVAAGSYPTPLRTA